MQRNYQQISFLELHCSSDEQIAPNVADGYTAFVNVYERSATVEETANPLSKEEALEGIWHINGQLGTGLLVITGRLIGEAIAQGEPFVMNTMDEIHQAIRDCSDENLS